MRKILLLAFVVLTSIGARAQGVTTASLSGVITDQKGEALPGATVVAVHQPSGTVYGNASRVDGYYFIPGMRVGGPYTVKTTFVGYKEQVQENVYLQLGQTFQLDFKMLDEGTQLQEVVVSGEKDPVLNSEKIGASSNFNVNQIQNLPSIGRDFRDISRLTPQAGGSAFSFGGRSNLYNNLTIDGATVNNVFGLNPLPAGQSGATPFGMDAIQEITVSLSPYDVRQGAFTGAGVSAITRSGTNDLSLSVYGFTRNQNLAGKKVDGVKLPVPSFNYKNVGFRVGGAIIKDKLFYFANVEIENRTDPFYTNPVRVNSSASTTGATQASDDSDPQTGLIPLTDFLKNQIKFDPGVYKNYNRATESRRFVVRFDYNINQNNKLTIRGNATTAFQDQPPSGSGGFASSVAGGRGNTNNVLSYSSSYYRINNNQYSVTVELNSTLGGGKYSNNLVAGFSAFRDFRENAGGKSVPSFPLVDILGPNGQNMTSFGPDPFTPNNKLDQNVIQLNDNFSIYMKNHTVTLGTANEYYHFNNVFTQVINGVYRYNSIADFIADADPSTTATARPASYTTQYVAVKGGPDATAAKWSAMQLGFFAQDEYTGIKHVKITGGVRVDIPIYLTDLPVNNYVNAINFNGEKVRVGGWPTVKPLVSPRVGFNWDVKGDRTTQLRGGTGVLTGRIPFVWLSNVVSNNGLYFGQFTSTNVPFTNTGDGLPYDFSSKPYALPSDSPTSAYSDLSKGMPPMITNPLDKNYGRSAIVPSVNTVAKNFRFPQVWRSNIAVDQQLPYGIVGTLEFIYTKDIHAVFIRDANLAAPVGKVQGDGRPLYGAAPTSTINTDRAILSNDRRVNGDVGQALVLDNTNKGYQWSITAQLQKNFSRSFQVSAAYTYTDAREVNPQNGSTAGSIFTSQANLLGPNNPGMSYANALTPHRIIAYGSYRKEYLKHFATTFSATYEGRSGAMFSYIYNGDMNSDGTTTNDLIYIPKTKDEIVLSTASATDNRTVDQIWDQLDTYIRQDKYLNSRRGKYAERNGAISPWVNRLNFSILQDFFVNVKGRRHTIQLSAALDNALNLFDSHAGLIKNPSRSSLIRFLGYEQPHTAGTVSSPVATSGPTSTLGLPWAPTTGRPVYTFETNTDGTPLNSSYIPDQTVNGRWQLQVGVRYIF
ncbi:MAG TPA: carboxypeptidase regulatory-like domain-containing protein [Cyclobacteriaceae bacterium]|nr:carboxypeptidase regulatory-like domain-containing protein [Cyclobacteriaceae bacterium]